MPDTPPDTTVASIAHDRESLAARIAVGLLLCMAAAPLAAAEGGPALPACVATVESALPVETGEALDRIADPGRHLLAMRSYLRARNLAARWSWDEQRIQAYQGSPEQLGAQAALKQVQDVFAARNPGYVLYFNSKVRSLDVQVERWNSNASVGTAAAPLRALAEEACRIAPARFATWLRNWRPAVPANLAAPGLSSHGQARAFDFQVMQGKNLVAGTDSRRIDTDWIGAGWAQRLADAIDEANGGFTGPLTSPNEPWHYAWSPTP